MKKNYPEHIWSKINDPLHYKNSNPIGSGPYKWLSSQPGEYIILERNPVYKWAPQLCLPLCLSTTSNSQSKISSSTNSSSLGFENIYFYTIPMLLILRKKRKR